MGEISQQIIVYIAVIFSNPVFLPESDTGLYVFLVPEYDMRILIQGGYNQNMPVRVEMKHHDINKAVVTAKSQVRGVISNLVYLSSTRILEIRPIAATVKINEREGRLVQFFGQVLVKNPKGDKINPHIVRRIYGKLSSMPLEFTYRVTRGIRWFRQALSSDNPIDTFLFLWIGLEAVEPRLREILGSTETKNCGEEWIRKLQEDGSISRDISYGRLKQIRKRIVHAYGKLVELVPLAESANKVLYVALGQAISALLEIETSPRIKSSEIENPASVRLECEFSSSSTIPDFGAIKPQFNIDYTSAWIEVRQNEPHWLWVSESFEVKGDFQISMNPKEITVCDRTGINPVARLEIKTVDRSVK